MILKLLIAIIIINSFIFGQVTYQGIGSFDLADNDKEFQSMDMNTAFLAILSNKYLKVYGIIQPMILKEIMFFDKIEQDNYKKINLIKNKIFAIKNDKVDVFEIKNAKIIKINEIKEKDVLCIKEDIKRERYYFYRNSGNLIYDFNFNKIKEHIIEKEFVFIMAYTNEGLYKNKKDNFIFNFSENGYSEEKISLSGEIIFFEGKNQFWVFDDNSYLLRRYEKNKEQLRINELKDIRNFLSKNIKSFAIKDLLISKVYDYIYLIGNIILQNDTKRACTLIYYYKDGYKLCNIKDKNEWKSIGAKANKFGNITFLSKKDLIFYKKMSILVKLLKLLILNDISFESKRF